MALEQPWDMARQWHCSWGTKASGNSITRGTVGPGMENVMEHYGGGLAFDWLSTKASF